MSSLRSQKLEVSAAVVIGLTAAAAGLLGMAVGRARAHLARTHPSPRSGRHSKTPDGAPRPEWRSVTELETRLRVRDTAFENLRRDYELDTGLLKEEVKRLREGLRTTTGRGIADSEDAPLQGTSRRRSPEKAIGSEDRPIRFSTLEDLVGSESRGGT